jgi:hypothetical protein
MKTDSAGFVVVGALAVGTVGAVLLLPYLRKRTAAQDAAYNEAVAQSRDAQEKKIKWDAIRSGFNIIPGLGDLLFGKG